MSYKNAEVGKAAKLLKAKLQKLDDKRAILRAPELMALYERIKTMPKAKRGEFGREVNALKQELEGLVQDPRSKIQDLIPIDVTAPFDVNVPPNEQPKLLPAEQASRHPLTAEMQVILDIFARMGFTAV